ncbi:hypothetical protein BGZ82_006588 [Podila clonocystis]|nr:hypothetical protein BGZ82_006588 [Podila clonocystis]
MLLNLVPPHKLHLSQRVTTMDQTEQGVMIQTSDGRTHEGEILVGADGAYSSVRQKMYERLEKIGELPISDAKPLPFRYIGLVGQTTPQNLADFPELAREDSPFNCIVGDDKHSMHPVAGLGAVNAMQDAVTLANWLNELPAGSSLQEGEKSVKEYRDERYPFASKAFRQSEGTSTLLAQNFFRRITRFELSYLPKSIIAHAAVLRIENRPQVAFLPPVSDRDTTRPLPQRSLFMTRQIMLERAKAL